MMYITSKVTKQTSLTVEQLAEVSPMVEEILSKLLPQLAFDKINQIENIRIETMEVNTGDMEPERGFFITVKAEPESDEEEL